MSPALPPACAVKQSILAHEYQHGALRSHIPRAQWRFFCTHEPRKLAVNMCQSTEV